MKIIDVPEYYQLAAENADEMEAFLTQVRDAAYASMETVFPGISHGAELSYLNEILPEVLPVVAAIHAMPDDSRFSEAVYQIAARHADVNRLCGLFGNLYFTVLEKERPDLFQKVHALSKKVSRVILAQYPELQAQKPSKEESK